MKKERNVFNKFYGKLAREGLLKSLMVSASIAFVVAGLCAFATWFLGINALWISLGIIGGLTLIYAAVSSKKIGNAKLPQERITIG